MSCFVQAGSNKATNVLIMYSSDEGSVKSGNETEAEEGGASKVISIINNTSILLCPHHERLIKGLKYLGHSGLLVVTKNFTKFFFISLSGSFLDVESNAPLTHTLIF
eukprot:sb/3477635/